MSLINEALRKARQEAAEREAEEKGVTYRPPRAHLPKETKLGMGLILGLGMGLLIAALGAAGAWYVLSNGDAETKVASTSPVSTDPQAARSTTTAPAQSEDPAPTAPASSTPASVSASVPIAEPPANPQPTAAPPPEAPLPSRPADPPATAAAAVEPSTALAPDPPPTLAPASAPPSEARGSSPTEPLPVSIDIGPANDGPVSEDLPKLIEPPEQVGRQGESNVFVLEAKLGDLDLVLDFIVWSEATPFAQINGQQVEVGQVVEGLMVESIERERVTLRGLDGSVVLRIR